MMTDVTRWSQAYLAELEQAAMALPADRRTELVAQISGHLDAERCAVRVGLAHDRLRFFGIAADV